MRHHRKPLEDLARIDPIDGDRLAAAWSNSSASQVLLEEITTMRTDTLSPAVAAKATQSPGSTPQRRSRRVLKLAVSLAVAAGVLVVVQGIVSTDTPAFAVRLLPNGVVEVDASTQFRDGEALAAELREYGIDVRITTVPSSPSAVGEVAVFAPGGGDSIPEGLSFGPDGTPEVFDFRIDPNLFTGELTIELHVAAREGERYQLAEEVFEPGEVLGGLQCALGEPLRAGDLTPYLADLGLTPVWMIVSPTDDPSITQSELVQEMPNGRVLSGYAQDATTVEFNVLPDGVTLPDIGAARLSDVPCTPEQAAAWD